MHPPIPMKNLLILILSASAGTYACAGAQDLTPAAADPCGRFGNAWDSEGEAWEALGDKEQAIKAYRQAVAVDKDQANAIARIEALRAAN